MKKVYLATLALVFVSSLSLAQSTQTRDNDGNGTMTGDTANDTSATRAKTSSTLATPPAATTTDSAWRQDNKNISRNTDADTGVIDNSTAGTNDHSNDSMDNR